MPPFDFLSARGRYVALRWAYMGSWGGVRCGPNAPLWGAENRHFGSLRPASLRRHMRSAAPFSPQFCTCAPTAERRCPLGSVHAGEQPHRSRSAAVSRSERSAQATRPPLAALATDLIASLISRPSASKLSIMDIADREATRTTGEALLFALFVLFDKGCPNNRHNPNNGVPYFIIII